MFKLLSDIKGMKEDRKSKFRILEECIKWHNILMDDYENEKYELRIGSIGKIDNNFKNVIEYLEEYIEQVQKSIDAIDNPEIQTYYSSYLLRDKIEALNEDFKAILDEIKGIYEIVKPVLKEYREEILK